MIWIQRKRKRHKTREKLGKMNYTFVEYEMIPVLVRFAEKCMRLRARESFRVFITTVTCIFMCTNLSIIQYH